MWKVGSDLHSDPPFLADPEDPVDPLDPLDLLENNGRLIFAVIYNVFCTFSQKIIFIFGLELFGALLAL